MLGKYPNINVALEISNCLYTCFDINVMKWDPPYSRVDFHKFEYKPTAKILVDLREIEIFPKSRTIFKRLQVHSYRRRHAGPDISCGYFQAYAVKDISRILNIELKDIIAFGDDYNDLEMLVECGRAWQWETRPMKLKGK